MADMTHCPRHAQTAPGGFGLDELSELSVLSEALSKLAKLEAPPTGIAKASDSARKNFAVARSVVGHFVGHDLIRTLLAGGSPTRITDCLCMLRDIIDCDIADLPQDADACYTSSRTTCATVCGILPDSMLVSSSVVPPTCDSVSRPDYEDDPHRMRFRNCANDADDAAEVLARRLC